MCNNLENLSVDRESYPWKNSNNIQIFFALAGEEGEGGDDRKKRPRTAFTAAQIKALESEFERNKYLSVSKRMQLSKQLKLTETQVRLIYHLQNCKWFLHVLYIVRA